MTRPHHRAKGSDLVKIIARLARLLLDLPWGAQLTLGILVLLGALAAVVWLIEWLLRALLS